MGKLKFCPICGSMLDLDGTCLLCGWVPEDGEASRSKAGGKEDGDVIEKLMGEASVSREKAERIAAGKSDSLDTLFESLLISPAERAQEMRDQPDSSQPEGGEGAPAPAVAAEPVRRVEPAGRPAQQAKPAPSTQAKPRPAPSPKPAPARPAIARPSAPPASAKPAPQPKPAAKRAAALPPPTAKPAKATASPRQAPPLPRAAPAAASTGPRVSAYEPPAGPAPEPRARRGSLQLYLSLGVLGAGGVAYTIAFGLAASSSGGLQDVFSYSMLASTALVVSGANLAWDASFGSPAPARSMRARAPRHAGVGVTATRSPSMAKPHPPVAAPPIKAPAAKPQRPRAPEPVPSALPSPAVPVPPRPVSPPPVKAPEPAQADDIDSSFEMAVLIEEDLAELESLASDDDSGEKFMCPLCKAVIGADDIKCPNCGAEFE